LRRKPESRSLRRKMESRKFDQLTGSRLAPGRHLCAYINAHAAKRLAVLKAPLRRQQIKLSALPGVFDSFCLLKCFQASASNLIVVCPLLFCPYYFGECVRCASEKREK
jgi:hypothetical protein